MRKTKKLLLIFFLAIFFVLISNNFSFAQEKQQLELQYPEVKGWKPTVLKEENLFPEYVKYLFNFAIMIAGLIAFGALVYGGFRYLTSAGSSAAIADAKDQILAAFLGLIILLCSYLILNTINPQLTILKLERPPIQPITIPPRSLIHGAYLIDTDNKKYDPNKECKPENGCLWVLGKMNNFSGFDFDDKADEILFTNPTTTTNATPTYKFSAVLFENADEDRFKDRCGIFLSDTQNIHTEDFAMGYVKGASAATVFRRAIGEEGKKIYEGGTVTICKEPQPTDQKNCKTYSKNENNIENLIIPTKVDTKVDEGFNDEIRSLIIQGNFLVVLFENIPGDSNFPGKCEVFEGSDPDLKDNPIGQCGSIFHKIGEWLGFAEYKSCVSAIAIYPIKK